MKEQLPIIDVKNLTKVYKKGTQEVKRSFLESLHHKTKHPMQAIRSRTHLQEDFFALRNLNFEIYPGEVVGIIGRNGAGKSTLLKVLSGITYPTEGKITLRGRVGSLLEVGTGFHPAMTGRENIYFNGLILGMSKKEINAKFDEIIKFSGVEEFLDTPVKRYSSGMTIRLGFAVAAHLDPEILVVDEVLAVGDAAFQRKCLGKMQQVSDEGRTVLFVSHNLKSLSDLCQTAILLDKGTKIIQGSVSEVINEYNFSLFGNDGTDVEKHIYVFNEPKSNSDYIHRVTLHKSNGSLSSTFLVMDSITINIEYNINRDYEHLAIAIEVKNSYGILIFTSVDYDWDNYKHHNERINFPKKSGNYITKVSIPAPLLNEGRYELEILLTIGPVRIHSVKNIFFEVKEMGSFVSAVTHSNRGGSIVIPLQWETTKV